MGAKESVNKVKAQDLTIMDEKKISIRVLASESSERLITNCYFGDYIFIYSWNNNYTAWRHGGRRRISGSNHYQGNKNFKDRGGPARRDFSGLLHVFDGCSVELRSLRDVTT